MRTVFLFLLGIGCLPLTVAGRPGDEKQTFTQLLRDDSVEMYTLASYDAPVRAHVFEACTQAEGIAKLSDIQKQSQEKFRALLSKLPKEEQEKLWNLTRYTGLIRALVSAGQLSKAEVEEVLRKYPQEIRDDATDYTLHHFELLQAVQHVNDDFDHAFRELINSYPSATQEALMTLLETPELISLLNSHMRMAVLLGDIYRQNPDYLRQQFDLLNHEQAEQKARDLADWQQQMKDDPEAEKELETSAKEYAGEYGYSESSYTTDPEVITRYVYIPYPYWCGYPWWYAYEWWYPYPVWYHWGFCYWQGGIYWMAPPSWYFVYWHFHHHPHFYHYPHITNVYINYYHHPRVGVHNAAVVHQWVADNREVLPDNFMTKPDNRVETIREYGKLYDDYDRESKTNPTARTPVTYLKENASKYPNLKPATDKNPGLKGQEREEDRPTPMQPEKPGKYPPVKAPDNKYEPRQPEKQVQPNRPQPEAPKPPVQPTPKHQPQPKGQPAPGTAPRQKTQPAPKYQPKPQPTPQPIKPKSAPKPAPKPMKSNKGGG